MAKLDLKSITRTAFADLDRRARSGDQEAKEYFRDLWSDAIDPACFQCDVEISGENAINGRPYSIVLPETVNDDLIIAPLCRSCRDLDKMVRMSRCLRLLRRMHRARTGRNIGFCFAPRRRGLLT